MTTNRASLKKSGYSAREITVLKLAEGIAQNDPPLAADKLLSLIRDEKELKVFLKKIVQLYLDEDNISRVQELLKCAKTILQRRIILKELIYFYERNDDEQEISEIFVRYKDHPKERKFLFTYRVYAYIKFNAFEKMKKQFDALINNPKKRLLMLKHLVKACFGFEKITEINNLLLLDMNEQEKIALRKLIIEGFLHAIFKLVAAGQLDEAKDMLKFAEPEFHIELLPGMVASLIRHGKSQLAFETYNKATTAQQAVLRKKMVVEFSLVGNIKALCDILLEAEDIQELSQLVLQVDEKLYESPTFSTRDNAVKTLAIVPEYFLRKTIATGLAKSKADPEYTVASLLAQANRLHELVKKEYVKGYNQGWQWLSINGETRVFLLHGHLFVKQKLLTPELVLKIASFSAPQLTTNQGRKLVNQVTASYYKNRFFEAHKSGGMMKLELVEEKREEKKGKKLKR